MVTPEMLLWLAKKVHGHAYECDHKILCRPPHDEYLLDYRPHKDDAQFGRLVVWAAMQGLAPLLNASSVTAGAMEYDNTVQHDDTPDSIRAAAVVAICRALGWEGEGMSNSRYPYTYAADYIRHIAGTVEGGFSTKISRADASRIRHEIASAIGVSDEEVALRLADKYLKEFGE